jgi:(p)ppGpp synthase/HD superfamily hydrolase
MFHGRRVILDLRGGAVTSVPINRPTERFVSAVHLACDWHDDQARKGTTVPYVSHLLGVASLVMEHGGTEDQAIAGLLHDAVEDAGGLEAAERIREMFGDGVADIVLGCSDATDPSNKGPWRERKTAYIAHLAEASPEVMLVSLCDKLHNARALAVDDDTHGDTLWGRFNAPKDEIGWYYRSLLDTFATQADALPASLLREFGRTIDRIWT